MSAKSTEDLEHGNVFSTPSAKIRCSFSAYNGSYGGFFRACGSNFRLAGFATKGGYLSEITMKELLESGVHFGHQTRRWNPKMKEYIFGERNNIHIIDLQKTFKAFKEASQFVTESASEGKTVLFVGTKRQAQEAVATEAVRCGQYYINSRWLGGLLTNWTTVQKSIQRLKDLEVLADQEGYEGRSKKEVSRLERERKHLHQNLCGIKEMPGVPDILFVIDSGKEDIAIREAKKLNISIVAVVDTNSDPTPVDYVIPGNDDALRAIRLFSTKIADAVLAGANMAADQLTAEGADDAATSDATEESADATATEESADATATEESADATATEESADATATEESADATATEESADATATEESADATATEESADVEAQNNVEIVSEVVPDADTIAETETVAGDSVVSEATQEPHVDTASEGSADVSTMEGESIKVQSGTTGLEPGKNL